MPRPPAKAQTLAEDLAKEIESGKRGAGAWLPSERDLAQTYGVDRATVRRSLRMLVEQNIVQSLEIAARAYVIENGVVAIAGSAEEVGRDPDLRRVYLGL